MYAIIENGSKQYKVASGEIVNLEKLSANVGDKVEFNVLLVSDENGIVLIIKVSSGLRFLKLVLFPVPDSPTIAIVSAAIILMQN